MTAPCWPGDSATRAPAARAAAPHLGGERLRVRRRPRPRPRSAARLPRARARAPARGRRRRGGRTCAARPGTSARARPAPTGSVKPGVAGAERDVQDARLVEQRDRRARALASRRVPISADVCVSAIAVRAVSAAAAGARRARAGLVERGEVDRVLADLARAPRRARASRRRRCRARRRGPASAATSRRSGSCRRSCPRAGSRRVLPQPRDGDRERGGRQRERPHFDFLARREARRRFAARVRRM